MAWTPSKQQQRALAALSELLGGSKGGGKGSGSPASRGKKDGIPNWDCRCGHTANWGNRPVCKRCGVEAPKWVLKLQAEKGTTPPPPPSGKGGGKGQAGGSPQPSPAASTPGVAGASAGNGEWRSNGKGGKSEPEPTPPPSENGKEAELRRKLEATRSTIRTAKSQGLDEETTELLQRKADALQAELDAHKPLDARFRSLLDQKAAAEAKVTAAQNKVSAAKEALTDAEAEESTAKTKLGDVEVQIEAIRRQQQEAADAARPTPLQPRPGDDVVKKLSENGLTEPQRQALLAALLVMGIDAKTASDRGLELAAAATPKQDPAGTGTAAEPAAPAAVAPGAPAKGLKRGAPVADIKAQRKRMIDATNALERLEQIATAEAAAKVELERLKTAQAAARARVDAAGVDPADPARPEAQALQSATVAVQTAEERGRKLADERAEAEQAEATARTALAEHESDTMTD